jgi:hypothetical protein
MIFIEEPVTYKQIQVPIEVVEYCSNYTRLNPYGKEMYNLRLLDCYWMYTGYYGPNKIPELAPVFE